MPSLDKLDMASDLTSVTALMGPDGSPRIPPAAAMEMADEEAAAQRGATPMPMQAEGALEF